MAGDCWSKIGAVALSLWVALLIATAPASASREGDAGGFAVFNLKASNGYSMQVIAASEAGFEHGKVLIWLIRKNSFATYFAPATVTDTTVEADLGPVGKIEFHGEEGYTDVTATRLPLSLHPYIDSICGGVGITEIAGSGIPGARLTATARKRLGRVSLQVNQNHPGARVKAQASIYEKRGRIQVYRAVEGTYSATAFHFDPQLRSASLTPPAPFAGSALFRRDAKAMNRWTGNLAVDFPGNSHVSLTGAGFETHLRHANLSESRSRPNRLPLSLPPKPR
jgi:hypothetical protein